MNDHSRNRSGELLESARSRGFYVALKGSEDHSHCMTLVKKGLLRLAPESVDLFLPVDQALGKLKMTKRQRAKSPFLPTARDLQCMAEGAPLRLAVSALPSIPTRLVGDLELADLPVALPCVRTNVTTEQAEHALSILNTLHENDIKPYADNSRRSIRSDWRHWIAFCVVRDRVAMPVSFPDLREFLDELMDAGYKRASLEHLIFTLRLASRLWSCPDPMESMASHWYWQQACRERLKKAQHQATAINIEDVLKIIAAVPEGDALALRDATMVSVAYDLMCRASELVAMTWGNISWAGSTTKDATYTIERSKTDQEGAGSVGYLTRRSADLLQAWHAVSAQDNPYVFHGLPREGRPGLARPLNVREVSRVFARAAQRAQIDKHVSGHSLRVGTAQDMTRAGMDLPQIMQAGRWKSPSMPARYAANEIASRSGRSREGAVAKLLKEPK